MSTGMDGQAGRHATDERRRGIAAWPLIVTGAVVLLVVATIAYFSLNRQRAVAGCSNERVLRVTASSGALAAVLDAAAAFDRTGPVARSTCIRTAVTAAPGPAVAVALTGNWKNQQAPAPDLWVADSEADVAVVDADNSSVTAGHPTAPFATSPLVLAVRSDRAAALQGISWKDLASGSGVGRSLKLALPDPVANRATAAALESLIGASRPTGGSAAVDRSAVDAARVRLTSLLRGTAPGTSTIAEALARLSQGPGDNEAVVPVVESELAAFNTANPGKPALQAIYPAGAVAGDTLLAVPITADWVDQTSSAASATFTAYLGSAAGKSVLAGSGLRTSASPPAAAAGIDRSHPVVLLPAANSQVRGSIAALWKASTTPAGGGSSSSATATATATATAATTTTARSTTATTTTTRSTTATTTTPTTTTARSTIARSTTARSTTATSTAAITTTESDAPTS